MSELFKINRPIGINILGHFIIKSHKLCGAFILLQLYIVPVVLLIYRVVYRLNVPLKQLSLIRNV